MRVSFDDRNTYDKDKQIQDTTRGITNVKYISAENSRFTLFNNRFTIKICCFFGLSSHFEWLFDHLSFLGTIDFDGKNEVNPKTTIVLHLFFWVGNTFWVHYFIDFPIFWFCDTRLTTKISCLFSLPKKTIVLHLFLLETFVLPCKSLVFFSLQLILMETPKCNRFTFQNSRFT